MYLTPYGQFWHHPQITVNLSIKLTLILKSESDPYGNRTTILTVHITEGLNLSVAHGLAADPSRHFIFAQAHA